MNSPPKKSRLLVWINGPFGIGKSTVAGCLADRLPESCLFNPEEVGGMLRKSLGEIADYRVWPEWRSLVALTINELLGPKLVVVAAMSVSSQSHWDDLLVRFETMEIDTRAFVLTADPEILAARIRQSDVRLETKEFRLHYLDMELAALSHGAFGKVIETGGQTAIQVCDRLMSHLPGGQPVT